MEIFLKPIGFIYIPFENRNETPLLSIKPYIPGPDYTKNDTCLLLFF
jgi:hypothetical protein